MSRKKRKEQQQVQPRRPALLEPPRPTEDHPFVGDDPFTQKMRGLALQQRHQNEDGSQAEMMAAFIQSSHSGPLPPAREMRQYEDASPGMSSRICAMAEKEQDHRHAREKEALGMTREAMLADIGHTRRGMWFGFVLVLVTLLIGAGLVALGMEVAGYAALVTALGSAIGGVIFKIRSDKKAAEKAADTNDDKKKPEKPGTDLQKR